MITSLRAAANPPRLFSGLSRSLSTAALLFAASALLGGCIENPADDPGSGRPTTATVPVTFRNANLLKLDFSRDSGRTTLKASNTGLVDLDSATILVHKQPAADYSTTASSPFHPLPEFECLVKVGRLAPGATQDLGIIDSLNAGTLQSAPMMAWLMRVSVGGQSKGNPHAGYFTGSYRAREKSGMEREGVAGGLIDAEGKFRFGLFVPGYAVPDKMVHGAIREDGNLDRFYWSWPNLVGQQGRLDAGDGGFLGTFTMGADASSAWLDSVEVRFESRLPPM